MTDRASAHSVDDLGQFFDHTLLKPEATEAGIVQLCREAIEYGFYAVCINSYWVPTSARVLRDRPTKVCSVVGFPLGANRSAVKAAEAEAAARDGAAEIDMVINIGRLMEHNFTAVADDITAVREVLAGRVLLKVIIESALLPAELKTEAARIVRDSGADFVKTSTGFNPAGGATVEDVQLLKTVVGSQIKVKASGGIRDLATTLAMLQAGADRIGASASVRIVEAWRTARRGA